MNRKRRYVRCASCSGLGWIATGKELKEEGPQYRRCDDCAGNGELFIKFKEKK